MFHCFILLIVIISALSELAAVSEIATATPSNRHALSEAKVSIDEIMTVSHTCEQKQFVSFRAETGVTLEQLKLACQEIADTERQFMGLFQAQHHRPLKPLPNDRNESLEVAVFLSSHSYRQYSPQLFGNPTHNGGIYYEGEPEKADNQARLITYLCKKNTKTNLCHSSSGILNLKHEFVHYLDGRYNQFGGFKYHKNAIAWTEGLAEYIAYGERPPSPLTSVEKDSVPPLQSVIQTNYKNKQLYQWSYFAIYYLATQHPDYFYKLADALRHQDKNHYLDVLLEVTAETQSGFESFVLEKITDMPAITGPE